MEIEVIAHTKVDTLAPFGAAERESRVIQKTAGSLKRYQRAALTLAGGVSSSLRRTAKPHPLYFTSGSGSQITDVDGNTYCDYALAWGPLILGHSHPAVARAVADQAWRGFTFGAQHDLEYEVAERLVAAIPCADSVCFASSGTEIVQVALRLARAATGRKKFLKFEGHYHGWDDSVLQSYHPSEEDLRNYRDSPVPVGLGQLPSNSAAIAEWNNRESVDKVFARNPGEIGAIICEALVCNSGCLLPEDGFLEYLREKSRREGALLIFDEVITGFRVAMGGAQERFGVIPDLATYAKACGAGTPLSVLAGSRQYMELIGGGKVIHAGTLNGNCLALAAAKAALDVLGSEGGAIFQSMRQRGERLCEGLVRILKGAGFPVVSNGDGPVFHIAFMDRPARSYRDTLAANMKLYSDLALGLLDEGVLVLPDGRWYLSAAHTDDDIEQTLSAVRRVAA